MTENRSGNRVGAPTELDATNIDITDLRKSQENTKCVQIDLMELFRIVWSRKLIVIGVVTTFIVLSVVYVKITPKWYRSDVLLAPASEQSGPGLQGGFGGLGGLAGLAGISFGNSDSDEPIAVLKSRDFARSFIEEKELLTVLLADQWDEKNNTWKEKDLTEQPDIRDAIEYFDDNVLSVIASANSDLITLRVEWTDSDDAAEWAGILVERLNSRMRERARSDAERNVAYLRAEVAETNIASLQQSISSILETELQKLMLAKGNSEFSFRVIDGAQVARKHVRPRGLLLVGVSAILGAMLALLIIFLRYAIARTESPMSTE